MIECLVAGTMVLRGLDARSLERLRTSFRFPNPAHERNLRFKGHAGGEQPWIEAMRELAPRQLPIPEVGYGIELPRGAVLQAKSELQRDGVDLGQLIDKRSLGDPIPTFVVELRDYQDAALQKCIERLQGMIVIPAGGGKTRLGTAIVGALGVSALVIVPTKDLVDQWVTALTGLVAIETMSDGEIHHCNAHGIWLKGEHPSGVTISTYEAAARRAERDPEWCRRFGLLIVDEAHAVPAKRLASFVSKVPARYRFGLSATPYREDGMDPLIGWTMGPVLFQITEDELIARGFLMRPTVTLLKSPFWAEVDDDGTDGSSKLEAMVASDIDRAAFVAARIWDLHAKGNRILVLGNRKALLENLAASLRARGLSPTVLTGDTSKKKRKHAVDVARGATWVWCGPPKRGTSHAFLFVGKTADDLPVTQLSPICGRKITATNDEHAKHRRCKRCADITDSVQHEDCFGSSMDVVEAKMGSLLLATSLADQGLDLPQLTVVVLAFPEKARGRLVQRIGRVMRAWPGKEAPIVLDVVDDAVPMFQRRFQKRKKTYERLGLRVRWEGEGT